MNFLQQTFGASVDREEALALRKRAFDVFRKPLIRKDIHTHGSLWHQYAVPAGITGLSDLDRDADTRGYVLIEVRGKGLRVFPSTLGQFKNYLESREDGHFHASYFFDLDFTFCLGENGERGAMRPIYVYMGTAR